MVSLDAPTLHRILFVFNEKPNCSFRFAFTNSLSHTHNTRPFRHNKYFNALLTTFKLEQCIGLIVVYAYVAVHPIPDTIRCGVCVSMLSPQHETASIEWHSWQCVSASMNKNTIPVLYLMQISVRQLQSSYTSLFELQRPLRLWMRNTICYMHQTANTHSKRAISVCFSANGKFTRAPINMLLRTVLVRPLHLPTSCTHNHTYHTITTIA